MCLFHVVNHWLGLDKSIIYVIYVAKASRQVHIARVVAGVG
jgi:hypothetical protein